MSARRAILSDDVKRKLEARSFAHLATLKADGAPRVEAVWVGREGERVRVDPDERTGKGRNMRRDPRVALSIPCGRVVEIRPDRELAGLDALSHKYLGRPFPRHAWPSRALYAIEPSVARYRRALLVHEA